jgi:hypothetical protein
MPLEDKPAFFECVKETPIGDPECNTMPQPHIATKTVSVKLDWTPAPVLKIWPRPGIGLRIGSCA